MRFKKLTVLLLSAATVLSTGCAYAGSQEAGAPAEKETISEETQKPTSGGHEVTTTAYASSYVSSSAKQAYKKVNGGKPKFTKKQLKNARKSYEKYGKLDSQGRCTTCIASVGKDIMPTVKRGAIGMVKPTGWHTVKYDIVDGKYLYNRCHLIGYQLTGENANKRNLITGTRYLNVDGMLPFENMLADYVKETGNHVLYRVKPDFKGKNLLASGVYMEAQSVEDNGKGIKFYVYCYNVQPGVSIDYKTGDSKLEGSSGNTKKAAINQGSSKSTYVYLSATGTKYHRYSCKTLASSKKNRTVKKVKRSWAEKNGYTACGVCKP